jgi:WS/DGAT/MGAT family acyltransferase
VQQLSGLDAAFLALETPAVYGHVASVSILDPSTAPEQVTLERLTSLVESRLHLVPPFRRRLVEVPLGLDQPYWIEDPHFDIEFHVRELALPHPGDAEQLARQAARLHARQLDRTRPLWELYLIHGLEGDRVAVYTKVHHAAIDGVSGNDILVALLDRSPEGRELGEVPPWQGDRQPSAAHMLGRSAVSFAANPVRAARMSVDLVRSLPALATSPARPEVPLVDRYLLRRGQDVVLPAAPLRAPPTPFNKTIGPHRRWAFCSMPLSDVKAVKNAAGGTVNDVVMALTAGALRAWLLAHEALPPVPLVAAVPVSVRTDEQKGTHGNRVSTMLAPLPTHIADPVERLREARESMHAAKEQFDALPADLLTDVTQFAMPALANQASRLAARLRLVERVNPFNLIVSNVPGPSVDLYLGGARLERLYPLSAIAHGQGLNVTVLGLGGRLHFGVLGDRSLVPDVELITDALGEELDALLAALVP